MGSNFLFNTISPVYGLFYNSQKRKYTNILDNMKNKIDLKDIRTVIDIGCGTGALCSALNDTGMQVTGIEPAIKMLKIAIRKSKNKDMHFVQSDVLKGTPFGDNSFDMAIASYVAHGLKQPERKRMYTEMSRVASKLVIIHDYNTNRSPLTSFVEWMEGGDYFHFIKNASSEMEDCVSEMKACFEKVDVIRVDKRANWYICTPRK